MTHLWPRQLLPWKDVVAIKGYTTSNTSISNCLTSTHVHLKQFWGLTLMNPLWVPTHLIPMPRLPLSEHLGGLCTHTKELQVHAYITLHCKHRWQVMIPGMCAWLCVCVHLPTYSDPSKLKGFLIKCYRLLLISFVRESGSLKGCPTIKTLLSSDLKWFGGLSVDWVLARAPWNRKIWWIREIVIIGVILEMSWLDY